MKRTVNWTFAIVLLFCGAAVLRLVEFVLFTSQHVGSSAVGALLGLGPLSPVGQALVFGLLLLPAFMSAAIGFGLALTVAWKLGARADARSLALLCAPLALLALDHAFLAFDMLRGREAAAAPLRGSLPLDLGVLPEFMSGIGFFLVFAAFLRLTAVFPEGRRAAVPAARISDRLSWNAVMASPLVWFLAPALMIAVMLIVLVVADLRWPRGLVLAAGAVPMAALGTRAIASLAGGARDLEPRQRHQIRRLSLALALLVLAAVGSYAAFAARWFFPVIGMATNAAVAVAFCLMGIAVFYDGALSHALVIRRTTIIATLTLLALALAAGVENVVSSLLEKAIGVSGAMGALLSGALGALLLLPVRRPVSAAISKCLHWLGVIVGGEVAATTPIPRHVPDAAPQPPLSG